MKAVLLIFALQATILLMPRSVESAPQTFQPVILYEQGDDDLFIEQEEEPEEIQEENQGENREAPVQDNLCIPGHIVEGCQETIKVEGTLDKLMAMKIPQLYQPVHPHMVRIPFPTVHLIGQPIEYQQQIVHPTKVKIVKSSSFMSALMAHIRKFAGVFKFPHKTHMVVVPEVSSLAVHPPIPDIASVKVTASLPRAPPVIVPEVKPVLVHPPAPEITSVKVTIPSARPILPPPMTCCTSTSVSSSTTCVCDPDNPEQPAAEIKSAEEPSTN